MPIPPEFDYTNEDDFTQRFLIPMLQRLGYLLVVNYHGHAELGKDLIFAEIDRFGHVRYHGLQAKYEPSISLNEVESLITDCKQAFSNPFTHPQTGTVERISSFYAVNGGSIGPKAVQHYFNSLLPTYGGNSRLLQAKGLLTLDRWASRNQTENVIAVVNGLKIELSLNRLITSKWAPVLQSRINGREMSWCMEQFKVDAVSAYLTQPILQAFFDAAEILHYWRLCNLCNRVFDLLMTDAIALSNKDEVVKTCFNHLTDIDAIALSTLSAIGQVLQTLGPLAAI